MKLTAKLVFVFLTGVFGIVTLFAWQTVQRQHAWENEREESHANSLVQALAPTIRQAYANGGRVTVEQAVEFSSQAIGGRELRWIDGQNKSQAIGTGRQVTGVTISDRNGVRTAYSYVPFILDQTASGAIEVAQSMEGHDAFVQGSIYASVLSLVSVALLSAVVICFGGFRLVGQPLSKLITQVNQIGDGQLAQPPVLSSSDELGKLAVAISEMSYRLSEQRDTIRHTDRLGTVGTLAAGIAHELGTPLNVVSGRAGLIAGGQLSPEEIRASARTIKSESERMTAIIRQLLDFARQVPAKHDVIDLSRIVTHTVDLMSTLAGKANVTLVTELEKPPVCIEGDAAQIQQVLTNFITNAVAAMPDGGNVMVALMRKVESRQACLKICDSGVGIAPEDLQRIFEPFFTTKDVGQGTGLGLSIAYGIVKEHGGEIQVHSQPGKQTCFEIFFPLADQAELLEKES